MTTKRIKELQDTIKGKQEAIKQVSQYQLSDDLYGRMLCYFASKLAVTAFEQTIKKLSVK